MCVNLFLFISSTYASFVDMGKGIIAIDDLTIAQDEPVYSVYTRIRTLQYTTMLQMFSDIMDDYNGSLLKYHDKCLLLLQQQRSLRTFS